MQELNNIIKFYRDCYQIDLKGIRIKNFLSNQCEKRFFPNDNDLFHENYSGIPIARDWAEDVEKILYLNSKEKTLYAGSVFLRGMQNSLGQKKMAYVPLYIHELNLFEEKSIHYISVIQTYINPDFIEMANALDANLNFNFDDVTKNAPVNPFGFNNSVLLDDFFHKYFIGWDTDDLENYKDAEFDFKEYQEAIKSAEKATLKIYSCLMIGIFKKTEGAIGILHELNLLTKLKRPTSLLNHFFQFESAHPENLKRRDIYLPATLSSNQELAFFSADKYPISQIIGPPGTGKSYTIAALAIDAISSNKSVLIVTRNRQACKVVTNIIEQNFELKGQAIKAYNQVYRRSLISKLRKALSPKSTRNKYPDIIESRIKKILKSIEKIENQILAIEDDELKWGAFYFDNKDLFFSKFKSQWFQYKKRTTQPIWKLNDRLKSLRSQKEKFVKKYIRSKLQHDLHKLTLKKKREFASLNDVLKEKNLSVLDKKMKTLDFDLILKAIPLWTTTTKEISKCIPLKSNLFDLVIFDESSQCDIASALPVMFRGKKMIVVGDPNQLKHISFISNKQQIDIKEKYSIQKRIPDYRKESLIDWVNLVVSVPNQSTFLDEHFRSKSDLIQFSNEKFYDKQLKLIRSNPISDKRNSLEIVKTEGSRNTKGVNEVEAHALVERIIKITLESDKFTDEMCPTIGVISPFSEQVKFIKKLMPQNIEFDIIKKHKILIGTPFHFQGEERDIVLISFAIDSFSHFASLNYLNKSDVFNVLITRARNKQIVYTSIDSKALPPNSLLKEYLELKPTGKSGNKKNLIYDLFLDEVTDFLKSSKFVFLLKSTVVSSVLVDLVVIANEKYYCIDLIGYPGELEDQFSLENLRILNRMNTPLFFLPYSSWYLDEVKAKRNLLQFLKGEQHVGI